LGEVGEAGWKVNRFVSWQMPHTSHVASKSYWQKYVVLLVTGLVQMGHFDVPLLFGELQRCGSLPLEEAFQRSSHSI
jgi:hypothetical protein